MYTNEDLTKLKREVSLTQMAAQRITLSREGKESKGCCPFHEEKTPSFTIHTDKNGIELYKCFRCGAQGNVFQFVEKFDKISFNEAVEKVAQFAGWQEGKKNVEKAFSQVLEKEEPKSRPPEEW